MLQVERVFAIGSLRCALLFKNRPFSLSTHSHSPNDSPRTPDKYCVCISGSDAEKVQEVLSDPNPQVRVQGLDGSSHFRQDLTYQKSSHAAQIDGDERLGGPPYKPLTRDPGLRPG